MFTGKHKCWSLFLNKVADLGPATLFKKIFQHRCFPVNIAKCLKAPILKNVSKTAASALLSTLKDQA